MKPFKIWCETEVIRDKVLAKMESEGIKWKTGHRATDFHSTYPAPVTLYVTNNYLTQSKIFNIGKDITEITPEEYLLGGKSK